MQQASHETVCKILAAQKCVAGGGKHLENAIVDLENRNIECSAAKVIDRDLFVLVLAESVGRRRQAERQERGEERDQEQASHAGPPGRGGAGAPR